MTRHRLAEAPDGHPVGLLVPVKALSAAKLRLADSLEDPARMTFARRMAERVVDASGDLPVSIVCDHEEIAQWATSVGASVVWKPGRGLNGAVADAVSDLGDAGVQRVIVAHADLPFAKDFSRVAEFDGITLVPDRHHDGTNVCCVDPASGFRFAYGAGSFLSHVDEAKRLKLPVRVLHDRRLAWDIDRPADLQAPSDLAPELSALLDAAHTDTTDRGEV